MLRYVVVSRDGSKRIKYLTWDQREDEIFTPEHPPGDFFISARYLECEPLLLRGGDHWNHAKMSFIEYNVDDHDREVEPFVIHEVSQYERIELTKLSESAIWAEKPCVEWAGLQFKSIELRNTLEYGEHDNRGRLRVVTHETFGDGKTEMVM